MNYKKRLYAWMRINKIDDGIKVDAFISLVGPEVVDLLVALVSPANIEGKTYTQLSELLQKHYTSGTNELADLEMRSKKRLRNRLVAGVRSHAIKNRLLSEGAALTWDKAVVISTSMDTAQQNSKMMKSAKEPNS